jgi:hypothetical protein
MLELDEITSHILLLQVFASSSFAGTLGLSQLSRNADPSAAVQLDERLTKLDMSFDSVQDDTDNSSTRRRIIFHLRYVKSDLF